MDVWSRRVVIQESVAVENNRQRLSLGIQAPLYQFKYLLQGHVGGPVLHIDRLVEQRRRLLPGGRFGLPSRLCPRITRRCQAPQRGHKRDPNNSTKTCSHSSSPRKGLWPCLGQMAFDRHSATS